MRIEKMSLFTAYYKLIGTLLVIACFAFFHINVCAEEITSVTSAAVTECRTASDGVLYMYIRGVDEIQTGSTVQIGNVACDDVSGAYMDSTGIPVRTILILDNSNSLSMKLGIDAPKELMNSIIDNRLDGEQFKLVTVSDTFNELSDFSTDYDELKNIISGITYNNQDTYLTDCLYSYLSQESNGESYTRIILITDGADDNEITYTQTELNDLMKTANVVIHSIGASAGNSSELERLFSYSRITKGTGISVDKNFNSSEVISLLNMDYEMICLRVVPQSELLDGSVKAVLLKLQTPGGEIDIVCNAQMAFGATQPAPPVQDEPEIEDSEEDPKEDQSDQLPTIDIGSDDEEPVKKKSPFVWIIVLVIVLLGAGAVVGYILIKKKNKQASSEVKSEPEPQPESVAPILEDNRTEIIQKPAKQGGGTMLLWGTESKEQKNSKVTFSDVENPQRVFSADIIDKITIGRIDSNTIVLGDDSSVSSHHFEVIKKGHLYYVKDLNSSNGTSINGTKIHSETVISTGSIVEAGRGKYRITIED